MPGSTDISGLNVQFGALDFGSEAGSGTVDVAQTESAREQAPAQVAAPAPMPVPTAIPTQQPQSSLFSKPGSMRWVCVCELWVGVWGTGFSVSVWNLYMCLFVQPFKSKAKSIALTAAMGTKCINELKGFRECLHFSWVMATNGLYFLKWTGSNTSCLYFCHVLIMFIVYSSFPSSFIFVLWTVNTWAACPPYHQLYQIPASPHHPWAYPVLQPPPHWVFLVQPLRHPLQPLQQLAVWRAVAQGPCHLIWPSLRAKMSPQLLLSRWGECISSQGCRPLLTSLLYLETSVSA